MMTNSITVTQAHDIGATGAEPTEAERLLFEAWMKGHCWQVSGKWNGRTYVSEYEHPGYVDPFAMMTRQAWAAWRDRAALSAMTETQAAQDVFAERQRQISTEDYNFEHDDEHVNDEIAALACFYAMPPGARDWPAEETGYGPTFGEAIVPDGWTARAGDRRRDLVKAGALVLAEIERLDRAAAKEQSN